MRLALIAAGVALVLPLLASSGYSSNPPCTATCLAPSAPHGSYSTGAGAWPGMHNLRFGFGISSAYRSELDVAKANGMTAMVYIGGYNKTTCQFGRDDAWVRSHIAAILGHPAIRFYYIADEPHISTCPNAPAQIRARSDLVHSLDPGKPTVVAISQPSEYSAFAGTTDVMALVVYPCNKTIQGCNWSRIPSSAAQAQAAGVAHYWGVVQSFGDDYYKIPTAAEQRTLLAQWHATHAEGFWAYTWNCCGDPETLENHSELWPSWQAENR